MIIPRITGVPDIRVSSKIVPQWPPESSTCLTAGQEPISNIILYIHKIWEARGGKWSSIFVLIFSPSLFGFSLAVTLYEIECNHCCELHCKD